MKIIIIFKNVIKIKEMMMIEYLMSLIIIIIQGMIKKETFIKILKKYQEYQGI
jgi:hypothetical protein